MFRARREQSLGQALQRIRQQYGTAALDRLGSSPCEPASTAISTGSLALDLALGSGGIPRGRIS